MLLRKSACFLLSALLVSQHVSTAFSVGPSHQPPPCNDRNANCDENRTSQADSDNRLIGKSRRAMMQGALALFTLSSPLISFPSASTAAPTNAYVPGTIWLTGKSPQVPGQKPRDKSDTRGTRKDSGFLRSISDCKSQCERTSGPDGLAKAKEDCLSECQDVCCETYEQCTFAIVPRI